MLLIQADEQEPVDCKDEGREPLAGENEEDQDTTEKETSRVDAKEQDTVAGDEPQLAPTLAEDGDEVDTDKPSTEADVEKKDEGKKQEAAKKCDHAKENTEKEQLKPEAHEKEEKDEREKGGEQQRQNDGEKVKDKPQLAGAEKQGKTKKKSGPPSAVSRPRTSARAIRSSAKKDIIAKFQQGAPE